MSEYLLKKGQIIVEVDPKYFRPTEVDMLIGDASKEKQQLGWKPAHTLDERVKEMINADLDITRKEHLLKN